MSGDPAPDGFVLWTRLAPDPVNGGGMDNAAVEVEWQVAEDESMRKVVKKGKATASPALAHSVHVEVSGSEIAASLLVSIQGRQRDQPDRPRADGAQAGEAQEQLRFAFASCQHWEAGYWTAYEHMLADNPDLVVHLGDYIYEGRIAPTAVRKHNSAEIITLTDYRNRHALYKTDPALQTMHTHCPWIMTWDDHEVDNNYAGDVPEDKQPREAVPASGGPCLPGLLRAHAAAASAMPQGTEDAAVPPR